MERKKSPLKCDEDGLFWERNEIYFCIFYSSDNETIFASLLSCHVSIKENFFSVKVAFIYRMIGSRFFLAKFRSIFLEYSFLNGLHCTLLKSFTTVCISDLGEHNMI